MLEHKRRIHEGIKRKIKPNHLCNECGKAFEWLSELKIHIKRFHEESKEKCDTCGRIFKFKHDLLQHKRRVHEGIPKYAEAKHICKKCGKAFKRLYVLKNHVKRYHEVIKEKCDICEKIGLTWGFIRGYLMAKRITFVKCAKKLFPPKIHLKNTQNQYMKK